MINKEQLEHLISDIEYLRYEAESLKTVIETVPYSEKPLGGESILESLMTINLSQCKVIEILNEMNSKGTKVDVDNYSIFQKEVLEEEQLQDIKVLDLLDEIINNRITLVDYLAKKPFSFYKIDIKNNSDDVSLFQLLKELVHKERNILKEVASLVLTYQKDRQFQREISAKKRV